MRRACRQRSKRSPGSFQFLLLSGYPPKGDHPKDWRAPTRKLDRQALYFLTLLAWSHSSSSSPLSRCCFVSSCSRWSHDPVAVFIMPPPIQCLFSPRLGVQFLSCLPGASVWLRTIVLWFSVHLSVSPDGLCLHLWHLRNDLWAGAPHCLPASLSSLGRGATCAVGVSALSLFTRPSALPSLPRAEVAGQPEYPCIYFHAGLSCALTFLIACKADIYRPSTSAGTESGTACHAMAV